MEEWVGSVVVIVSFGFGGRQQVVSQSESFDGDNKKICDSEFDGPMEMMKGNGQSIWSVQEMVGRWVIMSWPKQKMKVKSDQRKERVLGVTNRR